MSDTNEGARETCPRCYYCTGDKGVKATCMKCAGAAREKITARDFYRGCALIGLLASESYDCKSSEVAADAKTFGDALYDLKQGPKGS